MISRRLIIINTSLLLVLGTVSIPTLLYAAQPGIYSKSSGIAINGFDPVAYFLENKPVSGKSEFNSNWNKAIWHFSSQANKDRFDATPEKYAPQYGGYCAYAVSYGSTASTDPKAWSIVKGKLYLNYSLSIRDSWKADAKTYIRKANNNWPDVLK